MDEKTAGQITHILRRWKRGDEDAADQLFPLVYGELRAVAAAYLARERSDHTLQPTALVHESYLRLAKVVDLDAVDRSHFFAVAARTMRRILVDHARQQVANRRVGAHRKLPLSEEALGRLDDPAQILSIHDALGDLERERPRAAKLVEFRFFAGFSESEAAELMSLLRATATREWRFAKLWLFDYLNTRASP